MAQSTPNDGRPVCADCKQTIKAREFYTVVNPPGGYGREQVLVCDPCMASGRWDDWKRRVGLLPDSE